MKKFKEVLHEEPKNHAHHVLSSLTKTQRMTIKIIFFQKWRKLIGRSRLSRNQAAYAKFYFQEIHAHFYLTVVQGGPYVTGARIIRNYLLSKVNENIRAVVGATWPYNLTVFVQGMRSQVELNALLNKFVKDPEYHKCNLLLNEDRALVKELPTVINVNTLVSGLKSIGLPYQEIYDSLSLLLHPNPSAIKFYAQAEVDSDLVGSGIASPKINRFFGETIADSAMAENWFANQVSTFLSCVEHFLIMYAQLDNEFYLNDSEKDQHAKVAYAAFFAKHKNEVLAALNRAAREGTDRQAAVNKVMADIMGKKQDEK